MSDINKFDSQKKRRDYLNHLGKKSITDYIEPETKDYLMYIQKQYGYKRLGDAVDFVVSEYKKLRA